MFMVDTTSTLTDIDWHAFHAWRGSYPAIAGRYFGGGTVKPAVPGEFRHAKEHTGGELKYAVPIWGLLLFP